MKVLWLSENGFTGKYPKDFDNIRTDVAWCIASDGYHVPIGHLEEAAIDFDIGIIILPKREELLQQLVVWDLISKMRTKCKKIGVMQEGPHWYFQDYDVSLQSWFHQTISQMDFILCHNEWDKLYYQGAYSKPVYVNRSLMIEDGIETDNLYDKEDKVIIGGNMVRWYGGWDSYLIASTFDLPMYAPKMGRMKPEENQINEISHIPYVNWQQWIRLLSQFKYAVHLMPTVAAGTFSLNCAYHGIPCIGNIQLDTQRYCFPGTSVEIGDMKSAVRIAERLKNDEYFYNNESNYAKEVYEHRFDADRWKETFFTNMETILRTNS